MKCQRRKAFNACTSVPHFVRTQDLRGIKQGDSVHFCERFTLAVRGFPCDISSAVSEAGRQFVLREVGEIHDLSLSLWLWLWLALRIWPSRLFGIEALRL